MHYRYFLVSPALSAAPASLLGAITAEPTDPVPGGSRTELLASLDDAALDALLETPIDPLLSVQVRHLGGAPARPTDNPHGPLNELFSVYLFGLPTTEEVAESITEKQAELGQALPTSGRKLQHFRVGPAAAVQSRLRQAETSGDMRDHVSDSVCSG